MIIKCKEVVLRCYSNHKELQRGWYHYLAAPEELEQLLEVSKEVVKLGRNFSSVGVMVSNC